MLKALGNGDSDLDMRNQQQGRRRGRGGPRPPQQGGIVRPEIGRGNSGTNRGTGNAAQMLEKYKTLARDATQSGDRITAEYYFQYADHYFRVLNENRPRFEDRQPQRSQRGWQDRDGAEQDGDDDRAARDNTAPDEEQTREGYPAERAYRDEGRADTGRTYRDNGRENSRDSGRTGGEREYRRDGRGDQNRGERQDVGGDGRDPRTPRPEPRDTQSQRAPQYGQREREPERDPARERQPRRDRASFDEAQGGTGERAPAFAERDAESDITGAGTALGNDRAAQENETHETARPRARRPRREEVPSAPSTDDPFAVRRSPAAARVETTSPVVELPHVVDSIEAEVAPKRRRRTARAEPGSDAELNLEKA